MPSALTPRLQAIGVRDERPGQLFWIEARDTAAAWSVIAAYLRASGPRARFVVMSTGRRRVLRLNRSGRYVHARRGRLVLHTTSLDVAVRTLRQWTRREGPLVPPGHPMWSETAARTLGVRVELGARVAGPFTRAILSTDDLAWVSRSGRP